MVYFIFSLFTSYSIRRSEKIDIKMEFKNDPITWV